jgi:transcriptional regulator with XRE-family HTH domain
VSKASPRAIFSARIKQARKLRGIRSQRALGAMMGLDKKRGSSRINRYEQKKSGIDLKGLAKLAETLKVPMAYLVSEDEAMAEVLLWLSEVSPEERDELVALLKEKLGKD